MNSLEGLLSPFDVDRFFLEYWCRKPLRVKGEEQKFVEFPGTKELPSLLNGSLSPTHWAKGHTHNAQASFVDRTGNIRYISAAPPMWPDLFNAGASLCFSALDQYDAKLTSLVKGIASTTRLPGTIVTTCYLTAPCSGSAMHIDMQHVFFMQVEGRKHWRIGQHAAWQDAPAHILASSLKTPGMKACLKSLGVTVASPEETGLEEVTLNRGDMLYLPPGFWHEGHTSDSHSLHYTLTFMPLAPWHMLVAYLRQEFFQKVCLRHDLRYTTESGGGDATKVIEAAIVELKHAVNRLTADDLERSFVQIASTEGSLKNYLMQS